jgi:hypothetical protein
MHTSFMHRYTASILTVLGLWMSSQAFGQSLTLYVSPPREQNTTRFGAIVEDFNRGVQSPIPASGTWKVGTFTTTINGLYPQFRAANLYGGAGGTGQYLFTYYVDGGSSDKVRVDLLPSVPVRYLGFWWQAGNAGNTIRIYDTASNLLATFNASTIFNLLSGPGNVTAIDGTEYPKAAYSGNPNLPAAGNTSEPFAYVNLRLEGSSGTIGRIDISGANFEVDNLAIAPTVSTDQKWVPAGEVPLISTPTGSISAKDDTLIVVPTSPPSGVPGNVSTNDPPYPGATFSVVPGSGPSHGTLSMLPDGSYTYTPTAGYKGTDSFTYQHCKPAPDATVCATAKVAIQVVPDAVNDEFKTNVDTPVTGNVAKNDVYPVDSTFTLVSGPTSGTLTSPINPSTGAFTFTPAAGSTSDVTFTYRVCLPGASPPDGCDEATVTIKVPAVAAPTASNVAISDSPVVGTPLTGNYVYGDVNGDMESASTIRWITNTTNTPTGGSAVSTAPAYTPAAADAGKYLFFCVTPVTTTGTLLTGDEACSLSKVVAFAAAAGGMATAIPTLSQWALLGLSLLIGFMVLARRPAA